MVAPALAHGCHQHCPSAEAGVDKGTEQGFKGLAAVPRISSQRLRVRLHRRRHLFAEAEEGWPMTDENLNVNR